MTEFTALLSPLNLVFLLVQVTVVLDAVLADRNASSRRLARQAAAPGLLTGLGILGTFVGILWGLLGFDVSNIQDSVPRLLEGMTTAFSTSVAGLTFALGLRFSFRYFDRFQAVREAAGHSISDVYTAIQNLSASLRDDSSALRAGIEGLRASIGGDNDSSLQSQTKLMRGEIRDRLDSLSERFTEFAKTVSELGTKALIEALSGVIRDFNEKLTEQFGENFKQLNEAVHKLVQWQDNYASQVAVLEEQFRLAAAGISESRDAVERIAIAGESVPALLGRTSEALQRLEHHNSLLNAQLEKFAHVADRAHEGLPRIEANIERLTSGVEAAVERGLTTLGEAQRSQRESQIQLAQAYATLVADVKESALESQAQTKALREALNASLSTLEAQLKEHHARTAQNWERTLKESVERTDEVMQQQVKNLDQTLGQELERAVNQLGRHLLGLHERLVADYTPLLESLRRVVEVSRTVERH